MIRASTIALVGLVLGAGLVTYQMKDRVAKLDRELVRVQRETLAEQERQHVLDAEWSLLNEPERLRRLAERHLPLAPMQPRQFSELGDAVRRLPAAAPEAPPAPAVVAEPPPTSPSPHRGEGRGEGVAAPTPPVAPPVAPPTPAARPPARQLETRVLPPSNVRPAAASITQETLAPPPGIAARPGSAAPRPAPAPAPAPAARPAVATTPMPAPVARPVAPPAVGSALGSGTSLPPPVPWTPPPR
jgi:hypothetical protein